VHRGLSPAAVHRLPDGSWTLSPPLPPVLAELAAAAGAASSYEPPEVLAGGEWTPAGDVYALAATGWAALAGRPPYDAADPLSRLVGAEPRPVARPDVPEPLLATLRAGLAHRPDERPDLAELVAERLDTLPPSRPVTDRTGRPLGSQYLLDELIGRGATGHVWRGHTRTDGRAVAVKLLRSELAEDPDVVTRFMRERATLTRLSHPHLVAVQDLVAEGDALAIVMDLVGGVDLRRLAANGALDVASAADLLAQTASALAAVHAAGIVHRDLKPENVLVETRDGRPYALLTDFGLARAADSSTLTRLTQLVGTPAYLAPELVAGREPGPPADVYALGVTGYELLAGRRPFPDAGTAALLRAHLDEAPPRPDGLSDAVWDLLAACLDKDPARRPSAGQAAQAWRWLAGNAQEPLPFGIRPAPAAGSAESGPDAAVETVGAHRVLPPADDDAPPPTRRKRWPWYALAAVVLVGGFTGGILLGHTGPKRPPQSPVQPPVANAYPIQAELTQQPDALPILKWTLDPKLFVAGSYVLVVPSGGGPAQVVRPPAHTLPITDAVPGRRVCYTVNGVGLKSPPQPPPPIKPACTIPSSQGVQP
jgi:serine/threonine protein kinase